MDATYTAGRRRLVAFVAVVFAFVCFTGAARAEVLVRTAAPEQLAATQMQAIEQAAEGNRIGNYGPLEIPAPALSDEQTSAPPDADKIALLVAMLLIPPPVDLIVDIPTGQPDGNPPAVVWGPDLTIPELAGGTGGQVIHTQSAPEPTSFVLGAVGGAIAAVGAWYRRRKAIRQMKQIKKAGELVAA